MRLFLARTSNSCLAGTRDPTAGRAWQAPHIGWALKLRSPRVPTRCQGIHAGGNNIKQSLQTYSSCTPNHDSRIILDTQAVRLKRPRYIEAPQTTPSIHFIPTAQLFHPTQQPVHIMVCPNSYHHTISPKVLIYHLRDSIILALLISPSLTLTFRYKEKTSAT